MNKNKEPKLSDKFKKHLKKNLSHYTLGVLTAGAIGNVAYQLKKNNNPKYREYLTNEEKELLLKLKAHKAQNLK